MTVKSKKESAGLPTCGIIMPISECDGRTAAHWSDVLAIMENAATTAGFEARLVSDTFETNLIHKEILRNIYNDGIVICDVSGRNPNVFFELGIRIATQKPTIIVKDDKTQYPFDTSVNRYIEYPRDLRHPLMEKFKADLGAMIEKVKHQAPELSFIGQLGPFQIPSIESTEIPAADAILNRLMAIEKRLVTQHSPRLPSQRYSLDIHEGSILFRRVSGDAVEACIKEVSADSITEGIDEIKERSSWLVAFDDMKKIGELHYHVRISGPDAPLKEFQRDFSNKVDQAVPF